MPRRVPKLPQAVLSQEQTAFVQGFSIANFASLGTLLGRSLEQAEQASLNRIAQRYLFAKAIESNAPTVGAIEKRLAKIKKTAGVLREALGATELGVDQQIKFLRGKVDEVRKDTSINPAERKSRIRSLEEQLREVMGHVNMAGFFAGRNISERLKDRQFSRRITGQVDSNTVALLMRDLERACDSSARSSIHPREQSPSWVRLVRDLVTWAEAAGLSTTVSKRLQGTAGRLPPSRFVMLVKVMQAQFPAAYRQHTQSEDALSKAVSTARDVKLSKP